LGSKAFSSLAGFDALPKLAHIYKVNKRASGSYRGKRVFDFCAASLALVLLSPLLLGIALAVAATPGDGIVFCQTRRGQNGQYFTIYKFRTMSTSSPGALRLTRLGRFLRRYNLDELPQLFNVVRGEMSLVGPRPHIDAMRVDGASYSDIVPFYHLREQLKPGLTGWAQANGWSGPVADKRHAITRIEHDLAYAQCASFWFDLRILGRTLTRQWRSGS
jgi:polysaccharide biosynthesis protein PslA